MSSSSLNELSGLLWRERDVLDLIVSRLEDGAADWDTLLRSISSLELHRAITAREVAGELGIGGDATLKDLIRSAPVEWASILSGHYSALRALAEEIGNLSDRAVVGRAAPEGRLVVQRSLRDFLS